MPIEFGSPEAARIIEYRHILEAVEANFDAFDSLLARHEAAAYPHNYRELAILEHAAEQMHITVDELLAAVRRIRDERRTDYTQLDLFREEE